MEEALAALKATGRLPRGEQEEEPATRLWLLLLLAQMEDCAHHTAAALAYLEEATAHTPTCYDVYLAKARVLRHAARWRRRRRACVWGASWTTATVS